MKNIQSKTARNLMYAWHGGQFSPFYAAASSGLVESFDAIRKEINSCILLCANQPEAIEELNNLMQWVNKQEAKSKTQYKIGNEWYFILPWFGKVDI